MRKTGYSGVAKVTMHGRENIVIIRARDNGFTLHTMFYKNEIRSIAENAKLNQAELKPAESKLAMQLIETLAESFNPDQYSDTYQQELEKLIEAKAHGKKLTVMPRAKREHVPDLMSALKKSLSAEPARKALLRAVPKTGEKQKKARKAS
jgi:DNA end-binding protein Ku